MDLSARQNFDILSRRFAVGELCPRILGCTTSTINLSYALLSMVQIARYVGVRAMV